MARVKTAYITVKVDDKGTKVKVNADCAPASELTREKLEEVYNSQWKQYMYQTVQSTVKEIYPLVASNLLILDNIKSVCNNPGSIAAFLAKQEATSGKKFVTEVPNTFKLNSGLAVEHSYVAPSGDEPTDTEEDSEETEAEPEV